MQKNYYSRHKMLSFAEQVFFHLLTLHLLNTSDIVKLMAERLGKSQTEVRADLDSTLEVFTKHFGREEGFTLPGFGTFRIALKDKRQSYNISKGEKVLLPKKQVLEFSPSTALKETVKEKQFS
jgi:DNA-binding protein HU-beta